MRLIIAGSRSLAPTIEHVEDGVRQLVGLLLGDENKPETEISEVINGGAKGPDLAGAVWARIRGIPVHDEPITADDVRRWGKFVAPKIRNARMAERADCALIFWDGTSNGSTDMAMRMLTRAKLVHPVCMVPPKRVRT